MGWNTFAGRLKMARKARGLTLDALADKADCSKSLLSQYESGLVKLPRADLVFALADALEISGRWLTLGQGTQTQVKGIMEDEAHLLLIYRELPDALKEHLQKTAQSLADAAAVVPTRASPLVNPPPNPRAKLAPRR